MSVLATLLKLHEQMRSGPHNDAIETLKAEFDDIVMKVKPNVSWQEVIGLEDAKRAIQRVYCISIQREQICFRSDGLEVYCYLVHQGAGRLYLLQQQQQKLMVTS